VLVVCIYLSLLSDSSSYGPSFSFFYASPYSPFFNAFGVFAICFGFRLEFFPLNLEYVITFCSTRISLDTVTIKITDSAIALPYSGNDSIRLFSHEHISLFMQQSEKKNMVVTGHKIKYRNEAVRKAGSDIGYREDGEGSGVTVIERLNASAGAGKKLEHYTLRKERPFQSVKGRIGKSRTIR